MERNAMMERIAEVDSTNKYLTEALKKRQLPSGFVVHAEIQTHGRGQAGNAWESEPFKNLLFSVYFRPVNMPASLLFAISEMASLCVKKTLDKYIPFVTVKWPNDVYYQDKKISGILVENVITGGIIEHSIIGTGININQLQFTGDAPNPVSLSQITGIAHDKMRILSEFQALFKTQSDRLNNHLFDEIHDAYLDALYRKEGYHLYSDANGVFEARLHTIEPTGPIVLERTDGRFSRYAFKEVTYL